MTPARSQRPPSSLNVPILPWAPERMKWIILVTGRSTNRSQDGNYHEGPTPPPQVSYKKKDVPRRGWGGVMKGKSPKVGLKDQAITEGLERGIRAQAGIANGPSTAQHHFLCSTHCFL